MLMARQERVAAGLGRGSNLYRSPAEKAQTEIGQWFTSNQDVRPTDMLETLRLITLKRLQEEPKISYAYEGIILSIPEGDDFLTAPVGTVKEFSDNFHLLWARFGRMANFKNAFLTLTRSELLKREQVLKAEADLTDDLNVRLRSVIRTPSLGSISSDS